MSVMEKQQVCPECGSKDIVKHGYALTKKWGNRARSKCKQCASTFYTEIENLEGNK